MIKAYNKNDGFNDKKQHAKSNSHHSNQETNIFPLLFISDTFDSRTRRNELRIQLGPWQKRRIIKYCTLINESKI